MLPIGNAEFHKRAKVQEKFDNKVEIGLLLEAKEFRMPLTLLEARNQACSKRSLLA